MLGTRVVIEGSAESIAMRNKEAELRKTERLIEDMKEEFPSSCEDVGNDEGERR